MSKKKNGTQKENQFDELEIVLLKTVSSNYELNLTKNLLDEYNIPYIIQDHGIGGYMRIIGGDSLYGTDILVEKSTFEKAKDVLDKFTLNE